MRNRELDERIVFLFDRYDEVYGYRRIADELMSEFGIRVSRKYVLHRMRTLGIRSRIRRKKYLYKPCQKTEIYENILARRFKADYRNQVWETDVTEFHLRGEKCYLSPILDAYGQEIVAWNLSTSPNLPQIHDIYRASGLMLQGLFHGFELTDGKFCTTGHG